MSSSEPSPFGWPCATIDAKGLRPAAHAPTMHAQPAADRMNVNGKPCRAIGLHGLPLIQEVSRKKGGAPVNILTRMALS
jgi:hypothetical protein